MKTWYCFPGRCSVLVAAFVVSACRSESLPPDAAPLAALADGVSPAESLAIAGILGASMADMVSANAETCVLTWSAPGVVNGCSAPVPSVVPISPWLQHSGGIYEPEQREPIDITFSGTVRGLTLESTGALKCTGTHGSMVGFRAGAEVARADNVLIDPADCGEDDVTYGVRGALPPDIDIDRLVIEGVDPWQFEVFGFCCGRALLRYTVEYQLTPAPIIVSCDPSPVLRGTEVTCSASPPQGAATITVTEWRFVGPELSAPVIETSIALEWRGTAVTDGLVSVVGTVDAMPGAGSAPLQVSARDWTQDTVKFAVEENLNDPLPARPTAPAQLGDQAGFVDSYLPPDGYFQVSTGPNRGALFFTEVPIEGLSRIRINRVALAVGSDFYLRQPANNAPPGRCLRADVVPFVPLAENHEGLTLSSTSHAGVLRNELNRLVPQSTEHVVALNDLGLLLDEARLAAQPGITAAQQASRDQVNGGTVPPIVYCTFRYF